VPATRKLFALRNEAIACETTCSAGSDAISLPAELEPDLLELGVPLDPVPLLALEQPARITPAAAIVAIAIRLRAVRMPILLVEPYRNAATETLAYGRVLLNCPPPLTKAA
jgi:hypothetical protein